MNESRFPRKSYLMLYDLDAKGKRNWVTSVRLCLCQNGFGFVWQNQGVGDTSHFLRVFRSRLIDCRWQEWENHIRESQRFSLYKCFCNFSHDVQSYLQMNLDRHLKNFLTKFRFGISDIKVHKFRYENVCEVDLLCPLCNELIEDEIHFVLCCPRLHHIRTQLIPAKYYRIPCFFRLNLLLNSKNQDLQKKLAVYLYKSFSFRNLSLT